MNKTTKIILGAIAITGIATASIFALLKSGTFQKMVRKLKEKNPSFKRNQKLKLIAKALERDIKNTERRTSERYHNKNQKKYDEMNWDEKLTCRSDIFNN